MERHGGRVHGIVGPWNGEDWRTARPIAPYHKGDGHVTDDTLMTHALIRVYEHGPRPPRRVRRRRPPGARPDATRAGSPSWRRRPCRCSGSSSPRSGSWPGSTTATSTRARRASATSSTAARRCTWRRSAWSTRPTRRPPTPRRWTSRAPTSPRTAGRRRACSRRPWPRRARRARRPTRCRRRAARWPRTAPGRPSRRSCEVAARHTDFESALGPAAGGGRPLRHGRPGLPQPVARRPPPLPSARHRGTPHRPGHVAGRRRRLPPHGAGLGQLRPGLRLDRHDGAARSPAPCRRAAVPAEWAKKVAEASRLDLHAPATALAAVAREIFARDVAPPPRPRGGLRRAWRTAPVTAALRARPGCSPRT